MPKAQAPRKAKAEAKAAPAKKAKKDPNAPKRGLSAYMIFANEQRGKLKEEQPDLKFGEVGKVLGAKWKELTDSQKAPYNKKAEVDKKRYEAEKESYAGGAGAADDEDEE